MGQMLQQKRQITHIQIPIALTKVAPDALEWGQPAQSMPVQPEMPTTMPVYPQPPHYCLHPKAGRVRAYWAMALASLLLVSCTSEPVKPSPETSTMPESATQTTTTPNAPPSPTNARTPREYRRFAASHLYAKNSHRIFEGKLPPMLYAIGVLQVDINKQGAVMALHWMRAPKHAPEVMAEIERTVRQAAPYPAPAIMGRVTYTDTWLWDQSGKFQLDTLTEGQL